MVLAAVEIVTMALPFSPFITIVLFLTGTFIVIRTAARIIEILPG